MQFFAVLLSTIETHLLFFLLSWSLTAVMLLDAVKAASIPPSLLLNITSSYMHKKSFLASFVSSGLKYH